jgi:aminopeptidase
MNEVAIARKSLRKLIEKREEKGLFGWSLCEYPSDAPAKKAKLSIKEYSNQIIRSCFLNEKDPVAKWKELYRNAQKIKKWLNNLPIKTIHMESKSVDIKFSLGDKRQFLGVSGHNIPSFEIFTSPDWRGTEGIYFANLPSFRDGNFVKDVRLEFKKGNVIKASAKQGNDYLNKMVKRDEGSKRVGEFSLTDKRFSNINKFMANTLFDENFGGANGNSHIAIGMSYSDTFAGNPATLTEARKKSLGFNDSTLHWDIINIEKKTVTAIMKDGKKKVIYDNGMFSY